MKNQKPVSISAQFKSIYGKIFNINDTPQKIAGGLGLGVFLGIIPGAGPIASLVLASILRLNRASALLGSLLTNTWISIITFFLSVKIGSAILKVQWQDVYYNCTVFLKTFHWLNLFKASALKIMLPVLLGYLVIGFALGFLVYLFTLITLTALRHESKNRVKLSRWIKGRGDNLPTLQAIWHCIKYTGSLFFHGCRWAILIFDGPEKELKKAFEYLKSKGVEIENTEIPA